MQLLETKTKSEKRGGMQSCRILTGKNLTQVSPVQTIKIIQIQLSGLWSGIALLFFPPIINCVAAGSFLCHLKLYHHESRLYLNGFFFFYISILLWYRADLYDLHSGLSFEKQKCEYIDRQPALEVPEGVESDWDISYLHTHTACRMMIMIMYPWTTQLIWFISDFTELSKIFTADLFNLPHSLIPMFQHTAFLNAVWHVFALKCTYVNSLDL